MIEREPTYEEMRVERAKEWQANQATAAKNLAELHATLLKMPDVANAPSPDLPWSHPGITCRGCANDTFRVERWVTCNGIKTRAELHCLACGDVATWDWSLHRWIEDALAETSR